MRIKNWKKFQHFKDRRPPWIKLHREILDQRDITMISDCSFRILVGLWLLASEDDDMEGKLPSIPDIAFRLRIEEAKIIKHLPELSPWVEQDDISTISERYQVGLPETETETETETEVEGKKSGRFVPPTLTQVEEYCQERGNNVDPQRFIDFYASKGWMVGKVKMKDWKAAIRGTWEKEQKSGNGQQRLSYEDQKLEATKRGMAGFVGGDHGNPGQKRVCNPDG